MPAIKDSTSTFAHFSASLHDCCRGKWWLNGVRLLLGAVLIAPAVHLASGVAMGNGGPFATSSVNATGNLLSKRTPAIELQNELLQVKLESDWAEVEVVYTLHNGGGATQVTYGFPIDTASGYVPFGFNESIKDFAIRDGEKRIDITKIIKQVNDTGGCRSYRARLRETGAELVQ